jgi:ABC-2 type transport system permease protein
MNASASETRPMYWSIRREIWENRSIYIAPLIVAAVVLFASSVTTMLLPGHFHATATASVERKMIIPFQMAPAPIMLSTFLVGLFYCLDALYGERRDRSILFWKSLPVSDRTTVLSKVAVPLLVLPSIAYALSVVVYVILRVETWVVLLASRMTPRTVMAEMPFLPSVVVMGYGLAVHALWFAPIYAYLLLISAWARRAAFLWVVLPPMAIVAIEHIAGGSHSFTNLLRYRAIGAMTLAFGPHLDGDVDRLSDLSPGKFLSSPGLWLGLLFAVACIAAAIRLRRNREPI